MRPNRILQPEVDDEAPVTPQITRYDEQHFITYLRLLDADQQGAAWAEVARIVLHRDATTSEEKTYRCWESHLARAKWIARSGYKQIPRLG